MERARVDMPHPDPPLKGREFSSCAIIVIIAIASCNLGASRNASSSPRRRGSISSGAGDHGARPASLGSRLRGNDEAWRV